MLTMPHLWPNHKHRGRHVEGVVQVRTGQVYTRLGSSMLDNIWMNICTAKDMHGGSQETYLMLLSGYTALQCPRPLAR